MLAKFIDKIKGFLNPSLNSKESFKTLNIYSPIDGFIVAQKKIPDEGFSEGYMGVGVGLKPSDNGEVISPLAGKLEVVFRTHHAYIIRENKYGIAVMLHLGVNTVNIPPEEKAFQTTWAQGQEIIEKEVLCKMDLSVIRRIMKEEKGKVVDEEGGKSTSDISALLVQAENMEGKKVEILKKDGDPVSKGELIMKVVAAPKK